MRVTSPRPAPDSAAREDGDDASNSFTRFVNRQGSPDREFLDWHECVTPPATDLAAELQDHTPAPCLFVKQGFEGLPAALAECVRQLAVTDGEAVGVDTEMCIL